MCVEGVDAQGGGRIKGSGHKSILKDANGVDSMVYATEEGLALISCISLTFVTAITLAMHPPTPEP